MFRGILELLSATIDQADGPELTENPTFQASGMGGMEFAASAVSLMAGLFAGGLDWQSICCGISISDRR